MAFVKTFHIHPEYGAPDKQIRDWITGCEDALGIVSVTTTVLPASDTKDPRLNIIVTKLDDAA